MSFVRDNSSGLAAVAANADELTKYRAEKAARNKLKNQEARLVQLEAEVVALNSKYEELLRIVKNG